MVARVSQPHRFGGLVLSVGGILYFVAGFLHPQGARGDFHQTIASYLADPRWPLPHWLALISGLIIVWAIWLLADTGWGDGSVAAWAGARLAVLAGLFMAVEFAVELSAASEAASYAAGGAVPLALLTEPMQAVGWPAWMAGFVLLALGVRASIPLAVRIVGAIGAAAMGVGGIAVEGLKIVGAGPLFIGGALLAIWMVWAGVVAFRNRTDLSDEASRTQRDVGQAGATA